MKLWVVRAQVEVVVASGQRPDSFDAVLAIDEEWHENGGDSTIKDCDVVEVTDRANIPKQWRRSIPRGDEREGDTLCEDYFEGSDT